MARVLHRAEAVLAVAYIVVIHLVFGHFRRSTFPLNDAMFSGSVPVDHLEAEKPDWVSRLREEGRLGRHVGESSRPSVPCAVLRLRLRRHRPRPVPGP